jgi:hypothetical protein
MLTGKLQIFLNINFPPLVSTPLHLIFANKLSSTALAFQDDIIQQEILTAAILL